MLTAACDFKAHFLATENYQSNELSLFCSSYTHVGHIFGVRVESLQAPGFNHRRRTRPCDSGGFEVLLEEDLQEEEVDDPLSCFVIALNYGANLQYSISKLGNVAYDMLPCITCTVRYCIRDMSYCNVTVKICNRRVPLVYKSEETVQPNVGNSGVVSVAGMRGGDGG